MKASTAKALFPVFLVLFEFLAYIGNDMIQPAMPSIVSSFHASEVWVPTSMTAYLLGGAVLQWIFGPLSDRIGRRKVLFYGMIYFVGMCLLILATNSIEQFMLARFLQGVSQGFIGGVIYATVQEAFEHVKAIKISALMANVTMFAPLAGPVIGAIWLEFLPWQGIFVLFVILTIIALVGAWFTMPETSPFTQSGISVKKFFNDYLYTIKNSRFRWFMFTWVLGFVPLMTWMALSPIFVADTGGSLIDYSWLQVPVFGGLLIGNITLARFIEKHDPIKMVKTGSIPMVIGVLVSLFVTALDQNNIVLMAAGLGIYAFGMGLTNACLYRLTLFSSDMSKGTIGSLMGTLLMLISALAIEIFKVLYFQGGLVIYTGGLLAVIICWLITRSCAVKNNISDSSKEDNRSMV
ncbi:hypothetical protein AO724_11955 [Aeromonas allosaccharophila]|uniref:MdfA family multidrug efflux MFS transporter n=1 Tax=Aeromonas allosaccharophila TaxID=656 RepID=UPI0007182001|nr:MdfA family multidrug efflux MFS transporter [Aeromonas allosaccharophila]KRW63197.1 hypothetical protein AO724_11955 [Aeromonas allosaccharophila]